MSPDPHSKPPAMYWSCRGEGGQDRPKLVYQSSAISLFADMIVMPRNAWNGSVRKTSISRNG